MVCFSGTLVDSTKCYPYVARPSGDVTTRVGTKNTIIVEGVDPDSPTGELMTDYLNTTAFTMGHVILTTDAQLPDYTEEHELGHVKQGDILGIFYLPAHLYAFVYGGFIGDRHKFNFMEHWLIPKPRR